MMGIETIRAMAREAAETAAQENLVPFVYWDPQEVETYDHFPFPFLGGYVPEGWTLVDDTHFVDSSGLGTPDEPALTASQFVQVIKDRIAAAPGVAVGWAITQVGQFQVYVGEYHKVGA